MTGPGRVLRDEGAETQRVCGVPINLAPPKGGGMKLFKHSLIAEFHPEGWSLVCVDGSAGIPPAVIRKWLAMEIGWDIPPDVPVQCTPLPGGYMRYSVGEPG